MKLREIKFAKHKRTGRVHIFAHVGTRAIGLPLCGREDSQGYKPVSDYYWNGPGEGCIRCSQLMIEGKGAGA